MAGLEIIKAPGASAGEIADIISKPCPPMSNTDCDRLSCRECWLSWLVSGEPPKVDGNPVKSIDMTRLRELLREVDVYANERGQSKGPSDERTAQEEGEELARLKRLLQEVDDYVNGKSLGRTSQ